jgi:hypothetical protein
MHLSEFIKLNFTYCLKLSLAIGEKFINTPAIGQTVAVPIPTFDGGKGDSRNLLGIIIEVFNLTIFFYDHYSFIKI